MSWLQHSRPSLPNPSLPSLHPPLPGREGLKDKLSQLLPLLPGRVVEGWEKRVGVMRANRPGRQT